MASCTATVQSHGTQIPVVVEHLSSGFTTHTFPSHSPCSPRRAPPAGAWPTQRGLAPCSPPPPRRPPYEAARSGRRPPQTWRQRPRRRPRRDAGRPGPLAPAGSARNPPSDHLWRGRGYGSRASRNGIAPKPARVWGGNQTAPKWKGNCQRIMNPDLALRAPDQRRVSPTTHPLPSNPSPHPLRRSVRARPRRRPPARRACAAAPWACAPPAGSPRSPPPSA